MNNIMNDFNQSELALAAYADLPGAYSGATRCLILFIIFYRLEMIINFLILSLIGRLRTPLQPTCRQNCLIRCATRCG